MDTKEMACSIPGCTNSRTAARHLLCGAHQYRKIKGLPLDGRPPGDDAIERFFSKIDKTESCWNWTAALGTQGYGLMSIAGTMWRAHRYSYALHNGELPNNAHICHTCDNRRCVNPDHLYAGDDITNTRDKLQRNRQRSPLGEANGWAALTSDEVRQIRDAYGRGGITQKELGARFGVSRACISQITRRVNWRHI